MLESVWTHRPDLLTFHFGLPKPLWVQRAHELGISVGATATCLAEAEKIEAAGLDFIVAQGVEAGGHRGTFDPDAENDTNLTCHDLVRQIHSAISVTLPV